MDKRGNAACQDLKLSHDANNPFENAALWGVRPITCEREARCSGGDDVGILASDPDELIRLRRENRQLRQERDILSNQRGLRSACGGETGGIYNLS